MIVNFVISKDHSSRIFSDIFLRFMDSGLFDVRVSVTPIPEADIYHYHRPQLEERLVGPAVVTVHHDLRDPDPFVAMDRFIGRYREAEKVICLNSNQEKVLNDFGIEHTIVIPHGVDLQMFEPYRAAPLPSHDRLILGMASRRYGRRVKGEAYLYELAEHLPSEAIGFLLVGEGRSEDARFLMNLGFHVKCYEYLPYRLYPQAYARMHALLMCSAFEGGPANIPEAIMAGRPVLATPVGMVPDLIANGHNGLFLTGEPALDASRISDLSDFTNGRYTHIQRGAARTPVRSWDEVVNTHFEMYSNILNKSAGI